MVVMVPLLSFDRDLLLLLAEGDDYSVLKIVENLCIISFDELLQLLLQVRVWHLLQNQRGLGQHRNRL
jgi:hypothetical protein